MAVVAIFKRRVSVFRYEQRVLSRALTRVPNQAVEDSPSAKMIAWLS